MNAELHEVRIVRLETQMENVATKTDIANLELRMTKEFAKTRLWFLGAIIANMGFTVALVLGVAHLMQT